MSIFSEFREFIARGNVVDLAVGVIIGGAFGKIVTSLVNDIVMPRAILNHPFQRDLIIRALGDRRLVFPERPLRLRNPVITQTYQCFEALQWLRRLVPTHAPAGSRRYFIRRSPHKSRPGNNNAETPEFLAFLAEWNFEAIDFGNGERSIEQQIQMLSGAAVILAPHGAGLTNLAYLNPPLTVIELFSRHVLSASFLQIAVALGFRYRGFIGENVDDAGSILPDVAQLQAIMKDTVR